MKKNQIQFQFNTNYLKDNDCSLVIQRREFKIRPHTKTQTGTGRRGIANPQLASDNKDYVNVNITKGTA